MKLIREDDVQCMQDERIQRGAIVAALYRQRLSNQGQPGLSLPDLEQLLGVPKAKFEFSLWYLAEGLFVKRGDNGTHTILMKGVDLAENMLDRGILTQALSA
jgi:hypothetical protein